MFCLRYFRKLRQNGKNNRRNLSVIVILSLSDSIPNKIFNFGKIKNQSEKYILIVDTFLIGFMGF